MGAYPVGLLRKCGSSACPLVEVSVACFLSHYYYYYYYYYYYFNFYFNFYYY